jgi:hypothetical protein
MLNRIDRATQLRILKSKATSYDVAFTKHMIKQ